MFGMGGTEILVILIVALLFLGPDKLPDAAKKISKGIRDIKKQSRALQRTIEDDEHIGGAIRDLRSALRGEDEPYRPPPKPKQIEASSPDPVPSIGAAAGALAAAAQTETETAAPAEPHSAGEAGGSGAPDTSSEGASDGDTATHAEAPVRNGEHPAAAEAPPVTLPPTAGEPDGSAAGAHDADLAALVKPAPNTIARGATPAGPSEPPEPKHG